MIKFIDKNIEFLNQKKSFGEIFKEETELPNNLFNDNFISFKAFEFDLIYYDIIFNGLRFFLEKIGNDNFVFYTISPPPDKYFFKHFLKYSIAKITLNSSYEDFLNFLNEDPGGSSADALIYNSETFVLYSDNKNWGIIGSKDCNIAIVGFKDIEIENTFLSSFDDQAIFESVKDKIAEIDEVFKLTKDEKKFYADLGKNYS